MEIRVGFELTYHFPQPTPMILTLSIHDSRASDLIRPDHLITTPATQVSCYRDGFGNWCSRLVAPAGRLCLTTDALIRDSGLVEVAVPDAWQIDVPSLPEETLVYLLGSRYCETDQLSDIAWQRFGNGPTGWARVQAICDFVHRHIEFGYHHARRTRTAWEAYGEGIGVCRDYAHLAIALCRCMNIPARYCTGYLGDIGIPPVPYPMDFSAWFEVWLGDDARHRVAGQRGGHPLPRQQRCAAERAHEQQRRPVDHRHQRPLSHHAGGDHDLAKNVVPTTNWGKHEHRAAYDQRPEGDRARQARDVATEAGAQRFHTRQASQVAFGDPARDLWIMIVACGGRSVDLDQFGAERAIFVA